MTLAGCNSADLQTIANAENAIPQAVVLIANTSAALVGQGSMTPAEGTKVAAILTDTINANSRAVAATRAISSLTTANKATISQVLTPIIAEIQGSITTGDVFQIKDANAKLAITTSLAALVTTLQIIQAKVV
jgi:hypothetical protein